MNLILKFFDIFFQRVITDQILAAIIRHRFRGNFPEPLGILLQVMLRRRRRNKDLPSLLLPVLTVGFVLTILVSHFLSAFL